VGPPDVVYIYDMKAGGRRTAAAISVLALLGSSCGARLSQAQLRALRASGGAGAAAGGAGGDTGAADAGGAVVAGASQGAAGSGAGNAAGGAGGSTSGRAATAGSGGGGAAAAGGGAVCPAGAPSSDPGVSATTITVGNVSTLTGPVPGLFQGAAHGIQAFANYVNSAGGLCGRQLKVTSVDDNLDPGQNGSQMQALGGQVLGFAGSFSVVDQGGVPYLQSSGIPDIGVGLSASRATLANNFSAQPTPPGWQLGALTYFKRTFGDPVIKNMALFIQNAGTAVTVQQGMYEKAAAQSLGYAFTYEEDSVGATQSDFGAEVQAMKSKGVKGVFVIGDAQIMGQMAAQLAGAGYPVCSGGQNTGCMPLGNWGANGYDPIFISQGGPGANGAILSQSLAMYAGEDAGSVPEVKLFDDWYHRSFPGQTPDIYAAYSWMSGMMFVQAINSAGAPTRAALLKGLKGITNFGANGMIAPSNPATKTAPTCYLLIDVKGGKFVRDPADPPTGFRCGDGGYFNH
jgi:ABC-type branched-subunit amino acid transport system substrate-binding protein